MTSFSFGWWKRAYVADYLIGADQKIPDWQVKSAFLGEVVTAIKLGIKPWSFDVGLAQGLHFGIVVSFFQDC